jgi:membrane-associated phospholipid phosphatase
MTLQAQTRSAVLTFSSKLVSTFMGGEVMMVLVFVITFTIGRPSRTLYYIFMMVINCYFTIVLKLTMHRPRPYMVPEGEGIRVVGFSSEFGDPSGHTMSCAQVLTTVFLDQVNQNAKKRYLFISFMAVVISLVGYSRIYNGVHSLDQVLFGALIGLWIAFFGDSCIKS